MRDPRNIARGRQAAGFSLTEVMFAVFILGIGFIMLAAMFPVAIQQSRTTVLQTVGNVYARDAINGLEPLAVALSQYMAPTGSPGTGCRVYSFCDSRAPAFSSNCLCTQVAGVLINPTDPSYAFVPLYLRGISPNAAPNSYVQLFIIVCNARATSTYASAGTASPNLVAPVPKLAAARFLHALGSGNRQGVDQVTLQDDADFPNGYLAAVEGAYLIVSDPRTNLNGGQIFKLGPQISATSKSLTFQLDPSMPLATDGSQDWLSALVFLVGRGLADPTHPYQGDPTQPNFNPYTGAAQDVGVYTTLIRCQ